jgi:hypothetical protein
MEDMDRIIEGQEIDQKQGRNSGLKSLYLLNSKRI